MSHPLFSQPIPTLEEKKQWIKSALSVCDLNETQYAIVEINMIALMLRMDDAVSQYQQAVKVLEAISKGTYEVKESQWNTQDDRRLAEKLLVTTLKSLL